MKGTASMTKSQYHAAQSQAIHPTGVAQVIMFPVERRRNADRLREICEAPTDPFTEARLREIAVCRQISATLASLRPLCELPSTDVPKENPS
jgi:hypothetical protein